MLFTTFGGAEGFLGAILGAPVDALCFLGSSWGLVLSFRSCSLVFAPFWLLLRPLGGSREPPEALLDSLGRVRGASWGGFWSPLGI